MATFRGSSAPEKRHIERSAAVCLIRPYKHTDCESVKSLVGDAAMETVWDYYLQAVMSTLTPQLCFAGFAVGFVIFSWPFVGCASLMPVPLVLLYFAIWSGHLMKALELKEDAFTIPNSYMSQPDTTFYVAEVFDNILSNELAAHFNTTKKVEYDFMTEKELGSEDLSRQFKYRIIAGCLGVTKSHFKTNKAWIKRLTVQKVYRRRRIASNLLEEAITFCKLQDYDGIELVATDCHYQARAMFNKYGFTSLMVHSGYMGVTQQKFMFSMKLKELIGSEKQEDPASIDDSN